MKNNTAAKSEDIKIFFIVFLTGVLSRLIIFAAGVFLVKHFNSGKNIFEQLSQSGDVVHYIDIAKNGYAASGEAANKIVFYPLLPMLMSVFRLLFRDYVVSGLVISYAAFGVASVYMYRLARLDYDSEKSLDALLLMFMAPYGVFFVSVHTESLFVMLTVMTLYYARRENWIAAGILGFFAALSKIQGMLLVMPVVYELILCCIRDKRFKRQGIFSLLIPLGFFVYLLINKIVQGSFFAFVPHQAAAPWYNTAKWVSDSLATSYNVGSGSFSLSLIIYYPQIIMFFAAVGLIFAGLYKRIRTSYLVFFGAYLLTTYFHGWMLSGARYITSCAVVYIIMAGFDNKFVKYIIYLGSGLLCIYYMALWLNGYAIM